jgi:hypothetical protein
LSGAFGYRPLVLLSTTALLYKVFFLSIVKAFNVLFIFLLCGIKFYGAYMLFLLGWVVIVILLSGVRFVLIMVLLEWAGVVSAFLLASLVEPVVKFNG